MVYTESTLSHAVATVLKAFFLLPQVTVRLYDETEDAKAGITNDDWLIVHTESATARNLNALRTVSEASPLFCHWLPVVLRINSVKLALGRLFDRMQQKFGAARVSNEEDAWWMPSANKLWWAITLLALYCFVLQIGFNYRMVMKDDANPLIVDILRPHTSVMQHFYLLQWWDMFSPHPPTASFWHVIECTTASGDRIELFRNGGLFTWEPSPVLYTAPEPFHDAYRAHRWFKYWENGFLRDDNIKTMMGKYVCRNYNKRHSDPVLFVKISVVWQRNTWGDTPPAELEIYEQGNYDCRGWDCASASPLLCEEIQLLFAFAFALCRARIEPR